MFYLAKLLSFKLVKNKQTNPRILSYTHTHSPYESGGTSAKDSYLSFNQHFPLPFSNRTSKWILSKILRRGKGVYNSGALVTRICQRDTSGSDVCNFRVMPLKGRGVLPTAFSFSLARIQMWWQEPRQPH